MVGYFEKQNRTSPETYANNLIHELKITELPVKAAEVARALGIRYRESEIENGVYGVLKRVGDKALIVVNSDIPYSGRKNFVGGHEVGHYVIKGHDGDGVSCGAKDIDAYGPEAKLAEREATRFAASLLMPDKLVAPLVQKKPFSFDTIQMIADTCGVSLSSAAIKVTQLSEERCAVVISLNGKIGWSSQSRYFKYGIRRRGDVDKLSHAIDLFNGSSIVMKKPDLVLPVAWLEDRGIPETIGLKEYSILFSELNMVMTLLHIPNTENRDYEFDEEGYA